MLGSITPCKKTRALNEKASFQSRDFFEKSRVNDGETDTEQDGIRKMYDTMKSRKRRRICNGESTDERQKIPDNLRSMDKAGGRCAGEGLDRISNLAGDMIGLILSFLPTKDALRTCILSTQWKNHWMLVESLDFDYQQPSEHLHDSAKLKGISRGRDDQIKFRACVTRAIRLTNNSHLRRLSLKYDNGFDWVDTDWILDAVDSALSRGVCELDIYHCLDVKKPLTRLPCTMLLCTTLEVLKLGSGYLLEVPSSFCLPKLKVLSLDNIQFHDSRSFNRLISSCPMLEDLSLISNKKKVFLYAYAPSLKAISLETNLRGDIFLNTPRLASLRLAVNFEVYFLHPHNLVRAELELPFLEKDWIVFLNQINYVPFLRLSGVPAELTCEGQFWPEFPNLTHLCFGLRCFPGWRSLLCLLKKTPVLKTLDFYEGLPKKRDFAEIVQSDPCHLLQLRVIIIRNFTGNNDETDMIKFFLNSCKGLETLEIHGNGAQPELVKNYLVN